MDSLKYARYCRLLRPDRTSDYLWAVLSHKPENLWNEKKPKWKRHQMISRRLSHNFDRNLFFIPLLWQAFETRSEVSKLNELTIRSALHEWLKYSEPNYTELYQVINGLLSQLTILSIEHDWRWNGMSYLLRGIRKRTIRRKQFSRQLQNCLPVQALLLH